MLNTKTMKRGFAATIVLSMLVMLTACETVPQLTDMQKRQITTQTFNGSYNNILVATQTVIQDHQYVISQINKDSGLIVAQKTNDNGYTGKTFLGMPVYNQQNNNLDNANTGVLNLSATVTPITKNSSEVRISIQDQGLNTRGGVVYSNQIYNLQTFQDFFNQIGVEIQRREAIGRN